MNYTFYIKIDESGLKFPFIEVPSKYEMLSHLSYGELSFSKGVFGYLQKIEDSLKLGSEVSFAGDDWCIITIVGNKAIVKNSFEEFEEFELDAKIIIDLMRDWYKFLIKYENNQIPGICYTPFPK